MSLPSRECGLKFIGIYINRITYRFVTPLAGVWIEIAVTFYHALHNAVTPLAGVWIEIVPKACFAAAFTVTPLAGVWIEISFFVPLYFPSLSHSPRGSVD